MWLDIGVLTLGLAVIPFLLWCMWGFAAELRRPTFHQASMTYVALRPRTYANDVGAA